MSDEKVLSPEEAKKEKLVPSDKSKPLVPGHRNEKTIYPLSLLQTKIDTIEKAVKEMQVKMWDMMREYGPATQLSKQNTVLLDQLDNDITSVEELLVDKMILTNEELEVKNESVKDEKALIQDKEEDKKLNREIIDKIAEKDDIICFDFIGKMDGKVFTGGTKKRFNFTLSDNKNMVPGFEDQLIGLKAGDKKVVKVTFPEGYQKPEFVGKEAAFDVTVHSIKRIKKDEQKQ
jgi:hypothetical protein